MADTVFTAKVTKILATWLNVVNPWTYYGRRPNYATTTGAANAQILTLETGSLYTAGSEASGDEFVFIAGFTNNAAMTLQVLPSGGSNTARAVQLMGAALTGGEVTAGRTYKVTRLGVTWQLTNFTANTFIQSLLGAVSAAAARTILGAGSATSPLTTKGDLWGFSTVDARVPAGADGASLISDSKQALGARYIPNLKWQIYGLTYANNGGDSIDIAAGGAMDATNAYWITGSALTKSITANWAVGNAQGMLDTGSVGNSEYYLWAIARSDTGVVDYLASLSSTAPTMPTNYDFKRLIGWFKRIGGSNVAITIYEIESGGIELIWTTPTLDISLTTTLGAARRTDQIKVPKNFSVQAKINGYIDAAANTPIAIIYCPDQADLTPSTGATAPGFNLGTIQGAATWKDGRELLIRTSATGTIAARANITCDNYDVSTISFRWARRN